MKKLLIIPMLFMCSIVIGQSKKIIGNPIKIENLEVAQYDFPKEMNWYNAKAECAKLGKGWRLPTKDELNVMYKYKDKIGGFANNGYWSSTEGKILSLETEGEFIDAWRKNFASGLRNSSSKDYPNYVRAVRAF